jgi:hypothetical protein
MNGHSEKIAIVLHGPPCSGKTQTANELVRRLTPARSRFVSLDVGWAPGHPRYSPGSLRYADLVAAPEPVLVIEIGCGEPCDLKFPGATQGAAEWIELLRRSNRRVLAFALRMDWDDARARLWDRYRGRPAALFEFWQHIGLYSLFVHGDPIATFPPSVGLSEEPLNSSKQTIAEMADYIQTRLTTAA